MKSIKFYAMLMLLASVSFAFISCNDDDDPIVRPDYTKVKYTCSLGEDFLDFYNVIVTYADINGVEHTINLSQRNWQYGDRKEGLHKGMHCTIVATLKTDLPDLSPTSFDLQYTYSVEKYDKETSAIEVKPEEMQGSIIQKEDIQVYLDDPDNRTITILDWKG